MALGELDRSSAGVLTHLLLILPLLLQGLLGVLALGLVIKSWPADLVDDRRRFRWMCVGYLGVLYGGVMVIEMAPPSATPALRYGLNDAITLAFAVSACVVALVLARVDIAPWLSPAARAATDPQPEAQLERAPSGEADYGKFVEVFEGQRAYLSHGLSIAGLAAQMNVPQYRLRNLIHSRLGYRNFNALLHAYRSAMPASSSRIRASGTCPCSRSPSRWGINRSPRSIRPSTKSSARRRLNTGARKSLPDSSNRAGIAEIR